MLNKDFIKEIKVEVWWCHFQDLPGKMACFWKALDFLFDMVFSPPLP